MHMNKFCLDTPSRFSEFLKNLKSVTTSLGLPYSCENNSKCFALLSMKELTLLITDQYPLISNVTDVVVPIDLDS